jgi:hypothetical protein
MNVSPTDTGLTIDIQSTGFMVSHLNYLLVAAARRHTHDIS